MLQCALRDALAPVLETLPLAVKNRPVGRGAPQPSRNGEPFASDPDALRPAAIHIGDVRPKQSGSDETVPFVCLQESGGHDADSMTRAEILIRCAVYSPEPEEAAHELSNLLHTLRHALMPLGQSPLSGRYRLLADEKGRLLPYEIPTEQNHPYAEGYILSVWKYKSLEGVIA